MRTIVGIFTAAADADRAAERLQALGVAPDQITVLRPGAPEQARSAIPAAHGEQPGMGTAIGAVAGVGAGAPLGTALAMLMVPGIGPVLATGVAAGALLGLGGAMAGGAVERALTEGVPKDEVFVYEDALRQGRTVLVALVEDDARADAVRTTLEDAGAESVDAARERWWIGLRDGERERYDADGGSFERDEPGFRRGFEAALRVDLRGKSYDEARRELRALAPDAHDTDAFRRGYACGRAYWERLRELRGREAA